MEWLEGRDAIFLYLETPSHHMHIVFVGVFDPSTTPGGEPASAELAERVRGLLADRLHLVPRFRQRVLEVPFGLHHPGLVDDPDFDLGTHIRRAALPAPGGPGELAAFVGDIESRPLDRRRPLWEVHVVEGLEGGRWALVAKAHHALVDGVGGNELMVNLFDLTPEPRTVDPPAEPWQPEDPPTDLALLAGGLRSTLASPPRALGAAARSAGKLAGIVRRRVTRDHAGDGPLLTLGPHTMLNEPVGPARQAAFTDLPLDQVRQIKDLLGVKVNDVVLAVTGRALRRFLSAHGETPDSQLVAAVPISTRAHDDTSPGNRMSGMTVPLADDVDDPVEQAQHISRVTSTAKELWGAIGAEVLQDWTQFAAPAVAAQAFRFYTDARLSHRHRPLANLMISNVPGPGFPLYVAGSRLEAMYPLGPVLPGQGLNITVASYLDQMHVGIVAARGTVPPVDELAALLHTALADFQQAATRRRRRARAGGGS